MVIKKILLITIAITLILPTISVNVEGASPIIPDVSTATWSGCLNTDYTYRIHGWDPDENDQLEYRIDWGTGSFGSWTAFTNEYNDGGYTKAYVDIVHSFSSNTLGALRVQTRDDGSSVSPIYSSSSVDGEFLNFQNSGYDLWGDIEPYYGDQDTGFTFKCKYTDCDGLTPTVKQCYYRIQGQSWANEDMNPGTGNIKTGKWYTLGPRYFSVEGTGEYYFVWNDGTYEGRAPYTGYFNFEVSVNSPPATISTGDVTTSPSSFYRGESVTFQASTTDPDGDQIRYGWDWDLDNTVDEWSGWYNSGSSCSVTHTYGYNDYDGVNGEPLPALVKVMADDGQGGTTVFTPGVIDMSNYNPSTTTVEGDTEIGNNTLGYWNISITDTETDQMTVEWDWGDGQVTNSDYNISGSTVMATHTYTTKGTKTITATIEDEFAGSRTIYKTITVEDVPNPPINIQSTEYNEIIRVDWSKPAEDGGSVVTTYGIKWWNASLTEDTASFQFEIPYSNASDYNGQGFNITSLVNDVQCNFRLSCNNSYGMSEWSDTYNNTPGHTSPSTPVMQALSQYSGQTLDIEWSEPAFYDGSTLEKYYILYSIDNVNYTEYANTTQRTYHFTSLTNGVTYYFRVYVTDNQSGQSANSNYRYTTIDDINPTEPILDELSSYSFDDSITITWTESTDSESGISYYQLQEDDSTTFSNPINTYEGSGLNATFSSNHVQGKTYYYRVRAVDNAGNPSEWNGPVQTMLRTNETTNEEYSKITEVWFQSNSVVINTPVVVTVTVENKYTIPSGFVQYTVAGVTTEMRVSGVTGSSYSFSAIWQPDVSGEVDFQIKVVNSNYAANSITVPIEVSNTNQTAKPSVKVFEFSDDIVVVTFSETGLNVSSYQDSLNKYHVTFGTQPSETVTIDITELEPSIEPSYLWFIRLSWLDKKELKCSVHGNNKIIYYKLDTGYTIDGYNDWSTKWFGWFTGEDYTLVEETSSYIIISSVNKQLIAKK